MDARAAVAGPRSRRWAAVPGRLRTSSVEAGLLARIIVGHHAARTFHNRPRKAEEDEESAACAKQYTGSNHRRILVAVAPAHKGMPSCARAQCTPSGDSLSSRIAALTSPNANGSAAEANPFLLHIMRCHLKTPEEGLEPPTR